MNLKVGDVFQHRYTKYLRAVILEIYDLNLIKVQWYENNEKFKQYTYSREQVFDLATKLDERPLEEQVKELLG